MIGMNTHPLTLLLVGCGKMGGALLQRWQDTRIANISVIDPNDLDCHAPGVSHHKNLESLSQNYIPDIVVFAVKPPQLPHILPAYRRRFESNPLYISIAAGKTIEFFRKHLGDDIRIVRAMPNTPAMVGEGITILCKTNSLSDKDKNSAEILMQVTGGIGWTEDESLMDGVTAISGSGPAYVFLLLDALTKAGVDAGLGVELARTLALKTVAGSCDLATRSPGQSFEQLRKNVTSPGGTTEAALKVLMEDDALETLIKKAVCAAAKRSGELSNE
ncbi:MAG: pyrroline-5-carboxylate reductase [Pseudomonadota bacterium]|nr:pyrroline-5-carboxylate reductase [Pseudomonadota bacterium]MDE3037398.1 pyrroline-5-carboxylate reductase [Pseudomonadota bacterium]